MKTLIELEDQLKQLQEHVDTVNKSLKPFKDDIKAVKKQIKEIKDNETYKDFDDVMRKYYNYKLPEEHGDDLTDLHNYWNNPTDEVKMRDLFDYAEMDRYRTYDVAAMLWDYGCADNWLSRSSVSKKTIKGLEAWHHTDKVDYRIKNFSDIPEDEQDAVQEYFKLFYNITCNTCVCDW